MRKLRGVYELFAITAVPLVVLARHITLKDICAGMVFRRNIIISVDGIGVRRRRRRQ
jgi:hypothetical protein